MGMEARDKAGRNGVVVFLGHVHIPLTMTINGTKPNVDI